jgi:cell division protein FtsW
MRRCAGASARGDCFPQKMTTKGCHIDKGLLITTVFLIFFGILVLAGISANISFKNFGKTNYYLLHQIKFGIIPGIIFGFIAYKINLDFVKKYSWVFILISLILTSLVFVPGLRVSAGGASRWLDLKFFTFQPSEILKLIFIIYLSAWLSRRLEKKHFKNANRDWQTTFLPFCIVVGIIALILNFQKDLSTLVVILAVALITYFTAGTPLWQNVLMFFSGIGLIFFFIKISTYRLNRIQVLFNHLVDPMGIGYQLKQAFIAIGSGGIWGLGFGMSSHRIPQPMSDSVFAIIAEEMGFAGAVFLILFFLFFLWRGFKIAKNSQDKFSRLFATGFTSWILLQAFINIGSLIGIVPLTGIPLPFISYGGTHIVVELTAIGIMLNISKGARV